MEILVVTGKHTTRFFLPNPAGYFLEPFMKLIHERLEGGWYKEQFKDQAENLIAQFNALLESGGFNLVGEPDDLYLQVNRFLEKRRLYEYEEWEIVSTEN